MIVLSGGNNYFDLFSLPVSYRVSEEDLDRAYKNLQTRFHPDRFTHAGDRSRVEALRQTSMINDAYETLRSPLKRAAYLLRLNGIDPEEHNQAHLDGAFLIRQMEMREALEEMAGREDLEGLDGMKNAVAAEKRDTLMEFESLFNAGDYGQAKAVYNSLQFLFKLLDEIDKAEEELLDY